MMMVILNIFIEALLSKPTTLKAFVMNDLKLNMSVFHCFKIYVINGVLEKPILKPPDNPLTLICHTMCNPLPTNIFLNEEK